MYTVGRFKNLDFCDVEIKIPHNSHYVEKSKNKEVLLHNLRHENKTDVYIINFIGQFCVPVFVQMGENCKKWLKFLISLTFSAIM